MCLTPTSLYLGSLYVRVDQSVGNIIRAVVRALSSNMDCSFLQVLGEVLVITLNPVEFLVVVIEGVTLADGSTKMKTFLCTYKRNVEVAKISRLP